MRNHRLYEVRPDQNVGGWKVCTGKGTCVKRTETRREAITDARRRARMAAEDYGINTTLRVRNLDGTIQDLVSHKANKIEQ